MKYHGKKMKQNLHYCFEQNMQDTSKPKNLSSQLLMLEISIKQQEKIDRTVIGAAPQRHLFTGCFRLVTVAK